MISVAVPLPMTARLGTGAAAIVAFDPKPLGGRLAATVFLLAPPVDAVFRARAVTFVADPTAIDADPILAEAILALPCITRRTNY